jgi:Uma2 family endonuclease
MITAAAPRQFTPEDLLTLDDDKLYELIDGQLVENHMGSESSWVATRVCNLLNAHCEKPLLGWAWVENTFQCFPDFPNKVRRPDVGWVKAGRLPGNRPSRGHERVFPDLIVEVVSPHDLAEEIEARIDDFLRAGTSLIWVIYPQTHTVYVIHADRSAQRLQDGDELHGDAVVPGFRCQVSELFPATG